MVFLLSFLTLLAISDEGRIIRYNGSDVKTTFSVDDRFYGTYKGSKKGFLELRKDGTGFYRYDVFGFALDGCKNEKIKIEWGFLQNEDGTIVSFEREYGKSYPILFQSISDSSFKGCREKVLLDFITDKKGVLGVSSSDDWIK